MVRRTGPPIGGAGVICRHPVGHVADDAAGVDWVDLTWRQTLRRAMRLTSRGGRRIDVLLPPGGRLKHGDVLIDSYAGGVVPADRGHNAPGTGRVAVWLDIIDVLAMRPADAATLGRLAFDLGNRHLPTQFLDGTVLTPDDGPAHAIAAAHDLAVDVVRTRFYPEPVLLDAFR